MLICCVQNRNPSFTACTKKHVGRFSIYKGFSVYTLHGLCLCCLKGTIDAALNLQLGLLMSRIFWRWRRRKSLGFACLNYAWTSTCAREREGGHGVLTNISLLAFNPLLRRRRASHKRRVSAEALSGVCPPMPETHCSFDATLLMSTLGKNSRTALCE
jgi:hypothetical protein